MCLFGFTLPGPEMITSELPNGFQVLHVQISSSLERRIGSSLNTINTVLSNDFELCHCPSGHLNNSTAEMHYHLACICIKNLILE